jgi:EspG family
MSVIDTLSGRVLVSPVAGPDQRRWTTIFPGTGQRIATAVTELLESLPSGRDWTTHTRIRPFDAR